jgi:hypothetical protein
MGVAPAIADPAAVDTGNGCWCACAQSWLACVWVTLLPTTQNTAFASQGTYCMESLLSSATLKSSYTLCVDAMAEFGILMMMMMMMMMMTMTMTLGIGCVFVTL